MARRRKSALDKALYAMRPDRVLWRFMSGPEVMRALRSTVGTGRATTKMSPAMRQKKIAAMQRQAAKKSIAAKKSAARRKA